MRLEKEKGKELIRAFKSVTGLKIAEFSRKYDISREAIYAIERGSFSMQAAMARKIADEIMQKSEIAESELQEKLSELAVKLQEVRNAKKVAKEYV